MVVPSSLAIDNNGSNRIVIVMRMEVDRVSRSLLLISGGTTTTVQTFSGVIVRSP